MIFLSVGSNLPFTRLTAAVDRLAHAGKLPDRVFAQIGPSREIPVTLDWVNSLSPDEYLRAMSEAVAVIAHAGTGTILQALKLRKPLLVMPRLMKYGEAVDDHQVETATRFAAAGILLYALDERELEATLQRLLTFRPLARRGDSLNSLAGAIEQFLSGLEAKLASTSAVPLRVGR